jgi:agmatinase
MGSDFEASQSSIAFCGLSSEPADIEAAHFVVLPIPYEATTEWLPGTRLAPRTIIDSSRLLELYDHVVDYDISTAGIATAAELPPNYQGPEEMTADVERCVADLLSRGKTPVLLGGEHTITVGAARAMVAAYPGVSVLHLDAHADLRDEYLGTRYSQATVMRRVRESCPTTHVGIRSLSLAERRLIESEHIPVVFWPPPDSEDWPARVLDSLADDVYITLDADAIDPGQVPWVGTPEPGGMSWDALWRLLMPVAQSRHIVGFDVVEFAPRGTGYEASAYLLSKLIYRLIGAIHQSNSHREAHSNG